MHVMPLADTRLEHQQIFLQMMEVEQPRSLNSEDSELAG